jgi:hypothetical protein
MKVMRYNDLPAGISGRCLMALGFLAEGGSTGVTVRQVYEWLRRQDGAETLEKAHHGIDHLAHGEVPYVRMADRARTGKGRAATWELTRRGEAAFRKHKEDVTAETI